MICLSKARSISLSHGFFGIRKLRLARVMCCNTVTKIGFVHPGGWTATTKTKWGCRRLAGKAPYPLTSLGTTLVLEDALAYASRHAIRTKPLSMRISKRVAE